MAVTFFPDGARRSFIFATHLLLVDCISTRIEVGKRGHGAREGRKAILGVRTKGLNRKKEDGKEEVARGKGAKKLVFSSTDGTSEVFPFSQREGRQERWTETSA